MKALAFMLAALAPFSSGTPGAGLPAGWRVVAVPHARLAKVDLEAEGDATVLRIRAQASAASVANRIDEAGDHARLRWRWKIDRVVRGADLATKAGDDYAARVYVAFDVPASRMTFAERAKLGIARFLYGRDVPAAALCYVWDNRHPVGTEAWNAYSDHVRMIVVESGDGRAGTWIDESRDIGVDYANAFGARWPGGVPHVNGVAVSTDTDQTGDGVTAWFGDLRLGHEL